MLISEEYQRLNAEMHEANEDYGTSGHESIKKILELMSLSGASTLLDYGCGKGTLKRSIELSGFPEIAGGMREYDPAIPGKEAPPEPADVVVCSDVLEHVEPDCLAEVLEDLERVTTVAIYLLVSTQPAIKFLPDGRNPHLIIEPPAWWLPKIMAHFDLMWFERGKRGTFECIAMPFSAST